MLLYKAIAASLLAAAALPLSGCLVSGADATTVSGTQVAPTTLETLQNQAMTREQVIDLLGPPTRSTVIKNGEIFSYEWQKRKEGGGAVFLLFAHSHSTEETSTAYVQFENDIVTKTWVSE